MKTIKNLTADQLRKSILQLAIEGKLVKQDPNDEPASELVKKIMAEKKKLIQEGKIKKDKNESYIYKGDDNFYYEKIGNNAPVKLENLPFDIPDNWTWIRQKNICWLDNGEKSEGEKLPYLEAKVLRGKQNPTIVSEGVIVTPKERVILVDGENSGEIMAPIVRGYMGSTFKIFSAISCFNYEFLLKIFLLNKSVYKNSKTGAAIPHLNKELFKENLIAVPPFAEQRRIVDRMAFIEPLLAKYDLIEKNQSALEAEFPERLKKSILQYAIEGKLVKQDSNDEPASVLLERIKTEKERLIKEGKIKRDKNESYIYQGDDKNYYEKIFYGLPENWVKLNVLDTLLPMESTKPNCDFQYIDIDSIDNINHMIVRSKATKLEKAPSRATRKLKAGDILFSLVRPYLENVAIVYPNYANCIGSTGFYVCRPRSYIKTEFLFYYLITPYFINGVMKFIKGDNSPSIRNYAIESMLIGLPSLNEQERIVHKIKNLFAQIKQ